MGTFDYGESLAEKGPSFRDWPREGERTALIDGDLIPYTVAFCVSEEDRFNALNRVDIGECSSLEQTPEFAEAVDHVDDLINIWTERAGCDSVRVYMTGPTNYRDAIAFTKKYKDRASEKPMFFYELRDYILNRHKAILSDGCEADDLLATEMWEDNRRLEAEGVEVGTEQHFTFASCVCISTDKDLRMVPGVHYNPHPAHDKMINVSKLGELFPKYKDVESPKTGNITQRMTKLEGTGLRWFYAQILIGDSVDTYPGCPKVGIAKAYEELAQCQTEEQLYLRVLSLYKQKYKSPHEATNYRHPGCKMRLSAYQMMLEQGRLAWMQTRPGEIWRSHSKLPLGTDPRWRAGMSDSAAFDSAEEVHIEAT